MKRENVESEREREKRKERRREGGREGEREHARKGKREGLGGRERRTVCAMLGTFSLKSFTGALHSTCSITTVMQHRDTLFMLIPSEPMM